MYHTEGYIPVVTQEIFMYWSIIISNATQNEAHQCFTLAFVTCALTVLVIAIPWREGGGAQVWAQCIRLCSRCQCCDKILEMTVVFWSLHGLQCDNIGVMNALFSCLWDNLKLAQHCACAWCSFKCFCATPIKIIIQNIFCNPHKLLLYVCNALSFLSLKHPNSVGLIRSWKLYY